MLVFEIYNCWWKDRYYHQHLGTMDEGKYNLPDVNVHKMCLCQLLCRQQDQRDTLTENWSTQEHCYMPFMETS